MNINPIYWLRFTKTVKTKIDGHYVFKHHNFMKVFVSNPVDGVECSYVSDRNIKDQPKPQYIAEVYHKVDVNLHKFTQPNECNIYHAKHPNEMLKLYQKFNPLKEPTEE